MGMLKKWCQGGYDTWDSAIIAKEGLLGAGDLTLQIPFIKGRRSYLISTGKSRSLISSLLSYSLGCMCGVKP